MRGKLGYFPVDAMLLLIFTYRQEGPSRRSDIAILCLLYSGNRSCLQELTAKYIMGCASLDESMERSAAVRYSEGENEKVRDYDNKCRRSMMAASTGSWFAEETGTGPSHCSY